MRIHRFALRLLVLLLAALAAPQPASAQQDPPQLSLPGIPGPPQPRARPQQLPLPLVPGRTSSPDVGNSAGSVLQELGRDVLRSSGTITGLGLGFLDTLDQSDTCNTFDERLQRFLMNEQANILSQAGGLLTKGLVTKILGGENPGALSQSVGEVAGTIATHKLKQAAQEKIEQVLRSRFSNDEVLAFRLCELTKAGQVLRDAFEEAFDLRFSQRCNLRINEVDTLDRATFEERLACAHRDRADRAALDGMIDDVFQANLTVCRAGLALIRELAPHRIRAAADRPETLGCDSNEDVTRTWQAYLDGRMQ